MKKNSIWVEGEKIKDFPKLNRNMYTDVLVVGGGISGVLCAYELKKRGIDYTLVEKDKVGMGITKNTTAFITAQHETLYKDLIKDFGILKAKEYLDLNLRAVKKYKVLDEKYHYGFKECSSVLFTCKDENIIYEEKEALRKLGYNGEVITCIEKELIDIEKDFKLGIKFDNQGIINPFSLFSKICDELNIFEYTKVIKISNNIAYMDNDNFIRFNNIIIATHYPIINGLGLYYMKEYQRLSYVASFKYEPLLNTYCNIDKDGMYYRSYNGYLIVGGNDRNHNEKGNYEIFKEKIKNKFKNIDIEYEWINQDNITLDNVPYIGRYDIFHNNRYVITGFNLWGFTWAMIGSEIICDLIEKKKTYSLVSPQRNMINKEFFKNIGKAIKYIGVLKKPRCTHLGSSLHYNKLDNTWECPLHGSRFSSNGKVINGPAKKRINVEKYSKFLNKEFSK